MNGQTRRCREFRLVANLFTGALFRKAAEKQISDRESLFQTVANSAPVLLWMTDAVGTCVFLNRPWTEFTGRPLRVAMVDTWRQCVHSLDCEQLLADYELCLQARQAFSAQFRFRRHDGVYRWFRSSAVPRFDAGDQFAGYIGSCVDITDRKEAADQARDLSGRLIKAQEEERARLARELHDDISQRLARLTIDLGRAEREPSGEASMALVRGVHEALATLSDDVHSLSYRLHPSALVDLGLPDALKSECIKLAERESIVVDMKLRDLPSAIPPEVAIALFRIAQEAMRNAVRHGRARCIHLSMRGLDGGLQLAVRDDGIGFDPSHHLNRPSLGLASMRERTRLLRGELDVESTPGQGGAYHRRLGPPCGGMHMNRPRVLLVDDHQIVVEGLTSLLSDEFELVGVAGDGHAMISATRKLRPDVIVADIAMPRMNGIDAFLQLRKEIPRVKVVFLTMHREVVYARRAIEAGASGFLLKHSASTELIRALHAATAREIIHHPSLTGEVIRAMQRGPQATEPGASLTSRQREVVQLLAEGHSAKEIAGQLGISPRTVEFHKYQMMESMGLHNTAELILFALKHNLVTVP